MAAPSVLIAFALATAVFAYVPGPAMLYATAQTLALGRRGGFLASLGIHCGGYVHVLGATFGLSVIFRHVPEAYLALKFCGACYLVWLGIGLMRRSGDAGTLPMVERTRGWRALAHSMAVEVLNPKTALFFVAFLPQFIDAAAPLPVALQFLILGVVANLVFSSADIITVLLASGMVATLRGNPVVARVAKLLGGSILVGLGTRLAFERD